MESFNVSIIDVEQGIENGQGKDNTSFNTTSLKYQ